jgi:cell division protein FtsW
MVNMAVAVELPVTGQTLISGSLIWMTCFALGIIISVKDEEIEEGLRPLLNERKHFKTIDAELDAEKEVEEDYSIVDKAANR